MIAISVFLLVTTVSLATYFHPAPLAADSACQKLEPSALAE